MNNHQANNPYTSGANEEVLPGEEAVQQDSYIYPDQTPRQLSGAVIFNHAGLGIAGVILATFLIITAYVGIGNARLADEYAQAESLRSAHVTGVVTSAERYGEERDGEHSTLIYAFEFETKEGKMATGTSFSESLREDWHKPYKRSAEYIGGTRFEFEVGQEVEVHYEPSKANTSAVIKGHRKGVDGTDAEGWIIWGVVLWLVLLIGGSFGIFKGLSTLRDGLRVRAGFHDDHMYIYYQGNLLSEELNKQQIKLFGGGSTLDIILHPITPEKLNKAQIIGQRRPRLSVAEDGSIDSRYSICNMLQHLAFIAFIVLVLLYAME